MHTKRIAAAAAALFAAVIALFSLSALHKAGPANENAARPAQPSGEGIVILPEGGETLFPDLNSSAITSVTVSAHPREFEFIIDSRGAVSVNGKRADGEIFNTLITQISELPVLSRAAFSPAAAPLMTLTIRSGEGEHVACFYEDGAKGEEAFILAGSSDAPRYRQTDGWRIGTLLMTCEGTRIQDERGNEQPLD